MMMFIRIFLLTSARAKPQGQESMSWLGTRPSPNPRCFKPDLAHFLGNLYSLNSYWTSITTTRSSSLIKVIFSIVIIAIFILEIYF